MDDFETLDATIQRGGGGQSTPSNPAMNLNDYLNPPSKGEKQSSTKNNSAF